MKQVVQLMRKSKTVVAEVPPPALGDKSALVKTAISLVSPGTERMVVDFAGKSLLGKARSRPDLTRQMLDKVKKEGLLTAMDAAFNKLEQPMALGYSSSGTVLEVGSGLKGFKVGDRVACAGGGFAVHAEIANVPQNLLAHLPSNVDFESAAFATLGAISMHGYRLADIQLGSSLAVIGLGLLGLLTLGIARASGCQAVGIDIDPARVSFAKQLGHQVCLRKQAEETTRFISHGRGVDAVLVCADTKSNDPLILAGSIARDRARVVAVGAVGFEIPRKSYYEKELVFLTSRSYGPGRYDQSYEENGVDYPVGYIRWTEGRNLEAFLELLASRQLDVHPLITHRFDIQAASQAYDLITNKKKESYLGVLIKYPALKSAHDRGQRIINPSAPAVLLQPTGLTTLGVLGAGNYARMVFLPIVKKVGGIAPIAIASATGLSAQNASQKFGYGYSTTSDEAIIKDPAINVVAILTRHNLHARQVISSLKAGKRVFCEKPLAMNKDELAAITKTLKSVKNPVLMVGFNRRFAPFSQRLKTFISQRAEPLIAHYRINAGYLPKDHWLNDLETGGGRIIGEACHFIDYLCYLVGACPENVTAQALPDNGTYSEDNILLTFNFSDGSLGTIMYLSNGDKAFPKERIEVFCGGRVAVLDDFRRLELYQKGSRKIYRKFLRQDKGHRAAWSAFLTAIATGGEPPIPYDQLLGVTSATFAAVSAIKDRKKYTTN
ncbi:MAG: bi-domain-containing oxidoreductase [Anaerolineaceae bacterium]|nr:bi-domain-containing oxidoreductase [Anaerolineaceae bacterium]